MKLAQTTETEVSKKIKNPNPKVIVFLCKWCSSKGADTAGVSRLEYPPNILPIIVNCSSRVDPQHVVEAFLNGADGVVVSGCHPGVCHYQNGNYKALKRMTLLFELLKQIGVSPKRYKLTWIAATEGAKFSKEMTEFVESLKTLPPYMKNNKQMEESENEKA